MPFVKGMTRHPDAGRKKSPKKLREMVVDRLERIGCDPVRELVDLIPTLEGVEKAQVLLSLMRFCYPQLKSIDIQLAQPTEPVDVTPENVAELCLVARQAVKPEDKTAVGE